jgi:hypothetical protein
MAALEGYRSLTWLGGVMILLGIILVLIPYLLRYVPEIGKLPPIILYVYRRDGFVFATSPILIVISIIWVLVSMLSRYWK